MTKKFILVNIIFAGLLFAGTAEAKVCILGDGECETLGNYGPNNADCDESYKSCADPRAGSSYCLKDGTALYKDEDCCSTLGYKTCPEAENQFGYGKSCYGAVTHETFWEFCGCGYGFVDTEPEGSITGSIEDRIKDELENEIPYLTRCDYDPTFTGKCKLAVCNADRRWFNTKEKLNGGAHCVYRLPTRCGGFGCLQLYDCNNEEDYYRTDELTITLADGSTKENFLTFEEEDPWSNEK